MKTAFYWVLSLLFGALLIGVGLVCYFPAEAIYVEANNVEMANDMIEAFEFYAIWCVLFISFTALTNLAREEGRFNRTTLIFWFVTLFAMIIIGTVGWVKSINRFADPNFEFEIYSHSMVTLEGATIPITGALLFIYYRSVGANKPGFHILSFFVLPVLVIGVIDVGYFLIGLWVYEWLTGLYGIIIFAIFKWNY